MRFHHFTTLSLSLILANNVCAQTQHWQQKVNTTIEVKLDDQTHRLHGLVTEEYFNHSPDTLTHIFMHLYPNAYKNDRTAFAEQQIDLKEGKFYYSEPKDRGYIDSLNFEINDVQVQHYSEENTPDVARIDLPQPLLPGQSMIIKTPFRVKIPKIFSRLGHNGQAYFITQWFPKPAVYDKDGWHPIPYLAIGEFYSDFGNYDVTIHLPKDYVVMATGNIETPEEQAWVDQLSTLTLEQSIQRVKDLDSSKHDYKTIRFTENNVHDFAWFADKRYMVRKLLTPCNGDSVALYTAFHTNNYKTWEKATYYLQHTLDSLSAWVGTYPYKTMKAVAGDMLAGGGMEYPTITIIDRAGESQLPLVLVHEAGHNWFYGILGNNERQYPWMDEGVNSYYENRLMASLDKPKGMEMKLESDLNNNSHKILQSLGEDKPNTLSATHFDMFSYSADIYNKTAQYFKYLEQYLGLQVFDLCMKNYYNAWQGKHPYPKDMQQIFESTSGKNLSWFFDEMLANNRKIKTAITSVKAQENNYSIAVKNKSNFAMPMVVQAYNGLQRLASVNTETMTGTSIVNMQLDTVPTHFKITAPAFNSRQNRYTFSGKNSNGSLLHIGMMKWDNPAASINILPAASINNYDGMMAGLLIHNLGVPSAQFQYALAPMYAFKSKSWAGAGTLSYTFLPKKTWKQIIAQIDFKSFHYDIAYHNAPQPLFARYMKIAPGITFIWKQPYTINHIERSLQLKSYAIQEEGFNYKLDVTDSLYKPKIEAQQKYYGLIRYQFKNTRMINPYSYLGEMQVAESFIKLNLEGTVKMSYHTPQKGFYARGYFGKFFTLSNNYFGNSQYWLNSSFTGANDYLYDGLYFGRSEREGILSRQYEIKEGGESLPTHLYATQLGRSDNWLAAVNLKSDLPFGKLPLRLYFNASTFSNAAKENPSGSKILYSGGLQLYVLNDLLTLQVPLIVSKDYAEYYKSIYGKNRLIKSIAFSVQLDNFNVHRLQKTMLASLLK